MGGAYVGDAYESSLFLNPGQNNNHWVNLSLEGTVSNKVAIGAKIKVTFNNNGTQRSVYREVNSGGSFGSNPLLQHIVVSKATSVEKLEITWPVTGKTQLAAIFNRPSLHANANLLNGDKLQEGD